MAAVPDTPIEQLASFHAPTASVSPESATDQPKKSLLSALGALTYAWKLHVVPDRVYTYTAPAIEQPLSVAAVADTLVEQLSSPDAPTASVSPESANVPYWVPGRTPNMSPASALGALTYACIWSANDAWCATVTQVVQ